MLGESAFAPSCPQATMHEPSHAFRAAALLVTPLCLAVWIGLLCSATRAPLFVVSAGVLGGALIIIAVLLVLAVKWARTEPSSKRFDLASLLLGVIPLSLYFLAFKVVADGMPDQPFSAFQLSALLLLATLSIATTTVLLAAWTEALFVCLVSCFPLWRKNHQRSGS